MTRLKLSKRLTAIADFVDKKSTVADIGCDHALLDIFLVENKIINKAIACDITEGAIKGAKNNLTKYNISENLIELRLSNGLDNISYKDKIDTIVISGLGNAKIIDILKQDVSKLNNVDTLIIQSNTKPFKIRKEITAFGYYINEETLIKEKGIIYTITKFKKGNKRYSKKDILYGPILRKNKSVLYNEYISSLIENNNKIYKNIPNKSFLKKIKLKIKNISLKKELLK